MNEATRGLAKLLARRFIQRRDTKAVQEATGAYHPVKSRFTVRDLGLHLDGHVTYGHYVLDQAARCRVLAFDIDFEEIFHWGERELKPREVFGTDHPARREMNQRARSLADGLAWCLKRMYPNLIVLTAFSGSKGLHVYGCYPRPTTAQAAREHALDVLGHFGCFELAKGKNFYRHSLREEPLTIEVFPKQTSTNAKGFGNLLKLPLGINRKTGRRAFFYSPNSHIEVLQPCDPLPALLYGTVVPK